MSRNIYMTASVLACLACNPAFAEDQSEEVNANIVAAFERYDTNHDGYLSKQELKGRKDLLRIFGEADTDHDGTLDLNEYAAAEMTVHRAKMVRSMEDELITARVKAALLEDPEVKSLDVNVETYRGHVLLSGFADDESQVKKAGRIASGVRGVVSVKNALIIKI